MLAYFSHFYARRDSASLDLDSATDSALVLVSDFDLELAFALAVRLCWHAMVWVVCPSHPTGY